MSEQPTHINERGAKAERHERRVDPIMLRSVSRLGSPSHSHAALTLAQRESRNPRWGSRIDNDDHDMDSRRTESQKAGWGSSIFHEKWRQPLARILWWVPWVLGERMGQAGISRLHVHVLGG